MSATLAPPRTAAWLDARRTLSRAAAGPLTLWLGGLGLALWVYAVATSDYGAMNGYGLISVLGWTYFAGLLLSVVGFAVELGRPTLRTARLVGFIVLFAVFIYGTASAVEPTAVLTDSWIHVGFVKYILVHGQPLNGYDARFSWPGAFSLGATLSAFVGLHSAIAFTHWFPLAIELSYLPPLLVIARYGGVGARAGWLGIALYYSTNWILQDYFSPQALNYLFYLVSIAAVLYLWRPRPLEVTPHDPGSWRERLTFSRPLFRLGRILGHDAEPTQSPAVTAGLLGVLALVFLASSMSHQLTPYALALALPALLLARRLGRPEVWILLVVLAIGWLSLGASNFWVGHLGVIFGSIGQLGSKLSSNVTSRVTGTVTHLIVVKSRIGLTAAIYLLAAVGVVRRRADSRALEALAAAPVLLMAAQNYGGEGLMRVVLYGLPFVGMLAASAILPSREGQLSSPLALLRPPSSWAIAGHLDRALASRAWTVTRHALEQSSLVLVAVVLAACTLITTMVRGGNDAYESFTPDEVAAVNYVYNHIRPGQVIGLANYFMPLGQRDVGTVNEYIAGSATSATPLNAIVRRLVSSKSTFILLGRSESNFGVEVLNYPHDWMAVVRGHLVARGYVVVRSWPTATVLRRA